MYVLQQPTPLSIMSAVSANRLPYAGECSTAVVAVTHCVYRLLQLPACMSPLPSPPNAPLLPYQGVAKEGWAVDMVRINFTHSSSTQGSTTVVFRHMLHLLSASQSDAEAVAGPSDAAIVEECESVPLLLCLYWG